MTYECVCLNHKLVLAEDKFHITNAFQRADVGDSVSFTCNTKLDVRWYFNKVNGPISLSPILSLKSVNKNDTGYYYCFGRYEKKTGYFLAKGRLLVGGECINMTQ